MPEITLPFDVPFQTDPVTDVVTPDLSSINESLQPGDIAYYMKSLPGGVGEYETHESGQEIVKIGKIKSAEFDAGDTNLFIVTCITDLALEEYPSNGSAVYSMGACIENCDDRGDFIFFVKDRSVEESSLVGYYGEFKFVNNSKQKAEMYAASCEVSESSK